MEHSSKTDANWRQRCRFGFAAVLACACANGATMPETYPRAQAAIRALQLGVAIEHGLDPLTPAIPALFGTRGEIVWQRLLGGAEHALGNYDLAEAHWLQAQRLALAYGDAGTAADILEQRGEQAAVSDYARTERIANELSQLAERARLPNAHADAEYFLGIVDRRHGRLDSATAHTQRALEAATALGDERDMARALSFLGLIARDRGDYSSAFDLEMRTLAIRERLGVDLAGTLRNLALICLDLGDDKLTRKYFTRAIETAASRGDSLDYSSALGTYSSWLADIGEYQAALDAADEALLLARALDNQPAIGFDLFDSGRALTGLKRPDEARDRLVEALAIGRALKQHEIITRSQLALAENAYAAGDIAQSRALLDEISADSSAMQFKPTLVAVYALADKLAVAQGNLAQALDYAHKRSALRDELLNTRSSRALALLESQYERAEAEHKLAQMTLDNQQQAAQLAQRQAQRNRGLALIAMLTMVLGLLAWRFASVRKLNGELAVRNAEVESQRTALSNANTRLQQQATELFQAAIRDPLTGISNRGHLLRQLDARIAERTRDNCELAALLIDFDHFKQINDRHGHQFGDRVLVAGANALCDQLSVDDIVGRYGGEEFIVATGVRDVAEVRQLAERLRTRVAAALAGLLPDEPDATTISIGIALLSRMPAPARLEDLIEAADKAVYAAKSAGRNRVVVHAA
ncbi:MAG: GGDEF domain-containing protein [Xanthomonadales bacterium PRO7]|nr:GGDEF domain-containing protein [Xanthomonadales bacterium PRO7]